MKKVIIILLSISIILLVSCHQAEPGNDTNNSSDEVLYTGNGVGPLFDSIINFLPDNSIFLQDNNAIANETFEIFIDGINSKEALKIMGLFSESTREDLDGLYQDTIKVMEFIKGDIVSVSNAKDSGVAANISVSDGKKIKSIDAACIVETTEGKYHLAAKITTCDETNNDNVGMMSLYIIESKNWDVQYVYRGDGKWSPGINIVEENIGELYK